MASWIQKLGEEMKKFKNGKAKDFQGYKMFRNGPVFKKSILFGFGYFSQIIYLFDMKQEFLQKLFLIANDNRNILRTTLLPECRIIKLLGRGRR